MLTHTTRGPSRFRKHFTSDFYENLFFGGMSRKVRGTLHLFSIKRPSAPVSHVSPSNRNSLPLQNNKSRVGLVQLVFTSHEYFASMNIFIVLHRVPALVHPSFQHGFKSGLLPEIPLTISSEKEIPL